MGGCPESVHGVFNRRTGPAGSANLQQRHARDFDAQLRATAVDLLALLQLLREGAVGDAAGGLALPLPAADVGQALLSSLEAGPLGHASMEVNTSAPDLDATRLLLGVPRLCSGCGVCSKSSFGKEDPPLLH